ncbi:STML3 protein, partial [Grantiella picta]|nr:STML3 protein [Grantiella picta]
VLLDLSVTVCISQMQILKSNAVTAQVTVVVQYRIHSAVSAVANITDVHSVTLLLSQKILRNLLGTQSLAQLLAGREEIAHNIQGVKVARVDIKDIWIPVAMQRASAAAAEAAQETRDKVVAAEGEMNASKALQQASMVLAKAPAGLQLCYLQILTTVAAQNNSIVFPLPINMFGSLGQKSTGG